MLTSIYYVHCGLGKLRRVVSNYKRKLTKSAKAVDRHHAPSTRAVHPPASPCPPFLLAQNLSSKRIVPTDNMRPKSDAKRHHWLLKG